MSEQATAPQISVVVATRDRRAQLERLLSALDAQTLDTSGFEVIVVDDASRDGTAKMLEATAARVRFALRAIRRAASAGPGAARNAGLAEARGALIAFTDDDCEPRPRWLEAGLRAWNGQPDRMIQGRTLPHPEQADQIGPFTRTIQVDAPAPHYPTCNMFYPRTLIDRVGGFEADRYPFWGEDTDLAWRAIASGARPVFAPDAVVHHAVNDLGPLGRLRLAASWGPAMEPYARHPPLRRSAFTLGVFWKREHYWLARALVAAAMPRRAALAPVRAWLALPYALSLWRRSRATGGGLPIVAYHAVCDLLEVAAVTRAGLRHRVLIL